VEAKKIFPENFLFKIWLHFTALQRNITLWYILGGSACKLPEQSCLQPPTSHVPDCDTTCRI